jgi:hypothetical protein
MSETGFTPESVTETALERQLNLRGEWERQFRALNEAGVLEILPESHELGIVGIDWKEYPFPSYESLQAQLETNRAFFEQKVSQGCTEVAFTALALPLEVLIDRAKRTLLKRHETGTLVDSQGQPLELDTENPLSVWEELIGADTDGRLVYDPRQFTATDHGGQTKAELLAASHATGDPFAGWRVELVEPLANSPRPGQGQAIAGRKPMETNQTPREALQTFQTDPTHHGEGGGTVESYLTSLITGKAIRDDETVNFLTGTWHPGTGYVPYARWHRGVRRAYVGGNVPGNRNDIYASRARVRIPPLVFEPRS